MTDPVLIAGCGDLGTGLAMRLRARGMPVVGLRRNPTRLPSGIEPLAADLATGEGLDAIAGRRWSRVFVTSAAGAFSAEAYESVYVRGLANLLDHLTGAPPLVLVSSTGVYDQRDGEWVDETTPVAPTGFSGQALLRAEQLLASRAPGPHACLRLGGIYGPGRERLLNEVRAGIGCAREPIRYTNRIHREDAIGMLEFLGDRLSAGEPTDRLYLGVDDEPAPMWEVRHWLAERLGVTLDDTAATSPMLRAASNKRCSNARIRAAGYRCRYPDFRSGYGELITPP